MRKLRVIIFSSNQPITNLLKDYLSAINYEIISFPSFVRCPILSITGSCCGTNHPCADAIIVDFNKPTMNGLEFFKHQTSQGCKIINQNKAILANGIDENSIEQIRQLGYALFQKPVFFRALSAWLEKLEKRTDLEQPLASIVRKN